jgi:hypothetical protein
MDRGFAIRDRHLGEEMSEVVRVELPDGDWPRALCAGACRPTRATAGWLAPGFRDWDISVDPDSIACPAQASFVASRL